MDRNIYCNSNFTQKKQSLSARRAWIEIAVIRRAVWAYYVALRKESVDRNSFGLSRLNPVPWSLSARRAWIEIIDDLEPSNTRKVALRKESVDRNYCRCYPCNTCYRVALRKESVDRNHAAKYRRIPPRQSLSARRAWIEIDAYGAQCPD